MARPSGSDSGAQIDSFNQIGAKARSELIAFLQPFFAAIKQKGMAGGGGDGIKFNDPNDEITPDRYLVVPINAVDPDGNAGKIFTTAESGNFFLGWIAEDANDAAGDVIFGVGYQGNRAFRFRVSDDGSGFYEPVVVDDHGIDLAGSGAIKNLGVLTRGNSDYGSDANTLAVQIPTAGHKFVVRDASFNPIVEYTG